MWTCSPQAPGNLLLSPQVSHSCWNDGLNIHICIPLICLLLPKPRGRVTLPNISFYPGLEMCTAPSNKISVPPLIVQVQLWLQEKMSLQKAAFGTQRSIHWRSTQCFSTSTCFFPVLRLAAEILCTWTHISARVHLSRSAPSKRKQVWPTELVSLTSTV